MEEVWSLPNTNLGAYVELIAAASYLLLDPKLMYLVLISSGHLALNQIPS